MQFLVVAHDGKDALERRMKNRPAHLEGAHQKQVNGNFVLGGAIVDDADKMVGTAVICQFETRAELDQWLKTDPYVLGKVWEKIEVYPFRVAPHYHVPELKKKG